MSVEQYIKETKEEWTFARAMAEVEAGDLQHVREQCENLLSDCDNDLEDALGYVEDVHFDLDDDGVDIDDEGVVGRLIIALHEGEWK